MFKSAFFSIRFILNAFFVECIKRKTSWCHQNHYVALNGRNNDVIIMIYGVLPPIRLYGIGPSGKKERLLWK